MSNSEFIKNINRDSNFTLAQKRIVKDMYKEQDLRIAALEGVTPDPVELYGGTLLYGSVTWVSGLTFIVSNASYIIDGVTYTSPETTLTLTAADVTHPRIDVIYVDTDGTAGYVTGTPAADPAKPEVDQLTQLEMTFVTVQATATTPDNVAATLIYGEDAGSTAEWDATESTSTARITLADTTDPYAGTKDILCSDVLAGDYITLTDDADYTVGQIDALELHIKIINWAKKMHIEVAGFNGAQRVSNWCRISPITYGLLSTKTDAYQTIAIPKEDFGFTANSIDSIQIRVGGRGTGFSFYLDQIRWQTGGGTTIINNITVGLTEEELINNVRTWNAQQPFGNGTLTDGATITWDLDKYPVANVTLGGDRTIEFINARAGGTYLLKVIQDPTGTRLLTWDSAIFWAGGTAPTLSTTGAFYDVFSFAAFDSTNIVGGIFAQAPA